MGRKIPGRKHRGVKNPLDQQAKRNENLKTKLNAPPVCPDEQDIPKSLLRVMKLKKCVQENKFKYEKKNKKKEKRKLIDTRIMGEKDVMLPGMTRPDKPAPEFIQRPSESYNNFLYRIETVCEEVLKENKFEDKFNVNVERDPHTGEVVSVVKKLKDPINELEKKTNDKNGKSKKNKNKKEKLTKSEKRKQKLLLKKQSKVKDEVIDFDQFKDEVKFGEVVHQPPVLTTSLKMRARKPLDGKPRRRDLLLAPLLETKLKSQHASRSVVHKTKAIDLTGKRKNIPVAERRQLEIKRLQVVNAYRAMKASKMIQ